MFCYAQIQTLQVGRNPTLFPPLALFLLLAQQSELDDCSNLQSLWLGLLGNGFGCHGSTALSSGMTADLRGEVSMRVSHTAPH